MPILRSKKNCKTLTKKGNKLKRKNNNLKKIDLNRNFIPNHKLLKLLCLLKIFYLNQLLHVCIEHMRERAHLKYYNSSFNALTGI